MEMSDNYKLTLRIAEKYRNQDNSIFMMIIFLSISAFVICFLSTTSLILSFGLTITYFFAGLTVFYFRIGNRPMPEKDFDTIRGYVLFCFFLTIVGAICSYFALKGQLEAFGFYFALIFFFIVVTFLLGAVKK